MKYIKLISLLVAGLFVAPVAFAYDAPTVSGWTNKSQQSGSNRQNTPARVIKQIRNPRSGANVAGMASGDAVIYDTISDDGVTVNYTTTSCDQRFAGIIVTTTPTSDNTAGVTSAFDDLGLKNWGWMLTDGIITASNGGTNGTSATSGGIFVTSSDSGKITGIAATNEPGANYASKGGFFMDTPTTNASVLVMVKSN